MAGALSLRRVRAGECEALIRFIAGLNQPGPQHCMHFAGNEAGIRADIDKGEIDLTLSFWLAEGASGWRGVVGMMRDKGQGWLYGPWAAGDDEAAIRASLLAVAMAPPDLASLRAFTDLRSAPLVTELQAAGFVDQRTIHVLRATRERWLFPRAAQPASSAHHLDMGPALPLEFRVLADLHDAVLPDSGLSGRAMLAYADRAGVILVARDGAGQVLGSVCLALDPALREAEVEFLSVWPASRGQGVGTSLLRAALDESLIARRYHCVSLCVDGANVSAFGLYTANGFESFVTGVKQQWNRRR